MLVQYIQISFLQIGQPISVVNEDICIRCDFIKENNNCKRHMNWVSRAEFLPTSSNEVNMIKYQLENETFYPWDDKLNSSKVPYNKLPISRQEMILKEKVFEYSRNIYKK